MGLNASLKSWFMQRKCNTVIKNYNGKRLTVNCNQREKKSKFEKFELLDISNSFATRRVYIIQLYKGTNNVVLCFVLR